MIRKTLNAIIYLLFEGVLMQILAASAVIGALILWFNYGAIQTILWILFSAALFLKLIIFKECYQQKSKRQTVIQKKNEKTIIRQLYGAE